MEDNRQWTRSSNQFNDDWERERYRFNEAGRNRYIHDHGRFGNAGYDERYMSSGSPGYDGDRYGGSFYDAEGSRRHIAGTGYSAGSNAGNYGSDYNPGGYVRGRQEGSYGRSIAYNPYAEPDDRFNRREDRYRGEDRYRRNVGNYSRDFNTGYSDNADQGYPYDGSGQQNTGYNTHPGYRSSYAGGFGATGSTYTDSGMQVNSNRGNYGMNYEGPRYGRDRDWWDRTKDEVASWFGDRDAGRRRRIDEIIGKHKGKGPKNYHRSEARIREDIYDRLSDDDWLDASDIEVQVQADDVILTGTVHSREDKRRAEDIVESVYGVQNVENRIRVENTQRSGANPIINTPVR